MFRKSKQGLTNEAKPQPRVALKPKRGKDIPANAANNCAFKDSTVIDITEGTYQCVLTTEVKLIMLQI
jgi:uncharacterized protein